jgi:uncharacterized repeat protein (TIGR02543 family)
MRKFYVFLFFVVLSLLLFSCTGNKTSTLLKFETNGGNLIEDMEVSLDDDEFILPTPIREGYTFVNWFLDSDFDEPFSLQSLIQGDVVVLYAKWTENVVETEIVTITFVTNGGPNISPQDIPKGSLFSAPTAPIRDSHLFVGWFSDASLSLPFNFSNAVNQDVTLYAKWEIKVYTVIFLHEDGTELKTESVNHGSAATAPANPVKPETDTHTYTFSGWDKEFNVITSNLTVNAQFTSTPKIVIVSFYDADRTTLIKSQSVIYGEDATPPPNPTKASTAQYQYTFLGWDQPYINVTENRNLYATYNETLRSYTVHFYDADGITLLDTQTVLYGEDAILPANPTKTSTAQYQYTFLAWDQPHTNVTEDRNLYATYNETLRSYTVHFYDADGITVLNTQTVLYGEDATPPLYTVPASTDRITYVFLGFDQNTNSVTQNIQTVARVSEQYRIVYTIIFNPETPTHQNYTMYSDWTIKGDPVPPLLTPPQVDGYIFEGWTLIEDMPYVALEYLTAPLELYGVYNKEILQPTLSIHQAHESDMDTIGIVEGTVYIILPGLGFFMFDETGHILVVSEEVISLGDKVIFEAKVYLIEDVDIHFLTINSEFTILSTNNTLPTPLKMSVSEILELDDTSWVSFGLLVEAYGILNEQEEGYYLADLFGDSTLQISNMEMESPDSFELFVDQRVRLSGFTIYNPDMEAFILIYLDNYIAIEIVDPTDQELMDELVDAATTFLNHLSFYSGETLDEFMVTPPEEFNATVLWETFGPNADLFSFDTLTFGEVDEIQTIDIRITITIGDITEVITVQWYLKPIINTSISDVLNGVNEEYYIVEVVILYLGGTDEPMIVADETGILLVFGKVEANVGDLVVIKGVRYEVGGMVAFFGTPDIQLYEIKASNQVNPVDPTIYSLAQIQALTPELISYPTYIQTSGTIMNQIEFEMGVLLVSGENFLPIMGINPSTIAALKTLDGHPATLQGVLFAQTDHMGNKMYYMVYFNYPGSFDAGELTDDETIQLITSFVASLNLGELREGDILSLPTIHPIFGIEINWTPSFATTLLIDTETNEIKPMTEETILQFQVSFLVGDVLTSLDIEYVAYPLDYVIPAFTPGYLGTVPTFPSVEPVEGQFIGLFIYKDGYRPGYMSSSQREVHLSFPMPDEIGATHYTIQYFDLVSETWVTVMDYDTVPITLYYDNVTLRNPYLTMYRLYAHGIDMISNSVMITSNVINTEFLGYSLDESVYLSDIMVPFVGRGLEISTSVYDYDLDEYVEGYVTYQWYRVHPVSFQMTLIEGATDPLYITTLADAGYRMMVIVSGDGIHVGGFIQVFSSWDNLIPVEGYISDITEQGFTLNLSHFVDIDDLQSMELRNNMTWDLITITNITQGENAAIYYIEANLTGINDGYLNIEANLWVLVSQEAHMGFMMQQGIYIMFKAFPVGPPPPDGPPKS